MTDPVPVEFEPGSAGTDRSLLSTGAWRRNAPLLLSDFTARPFLLDWCEPVRGHDLLDLGCGEGFISRELMLRGARSIHAIDVSGELIRHACEAEKNEPLGIDYQVGDAVDLSRFQADSFDLILAVFLFNYLERQRCTEVMTQVHQLLKRGGRFVFAVPHPTLPFLRKVREEPFYFDRRGLGYFSGRDTLWEGEIWRRDGTSVPIRCVHKTLDDYFQVIREAGFRLLPDVKELHVTQDQLSHDPAFFSSLWDQPLHLAFRLEK